MTSSISMTGYAASMPMPPPRGAPDASKLSEELLSQADSDGNGSLSRTEFATLLGSDGTSLDAEAVDSLYGELDTDGDGQLGIEEVTSAVQSLLSQIQDSRNQATAPPPPPPGEGDMFSDMDTDGSGGIDQTEFSSMMQNGPIADQQDSESLIEQLFAEADSNGDGVLSEEELQASMPPPPPHGSSEGGAGGVQTASDSQQQTLSPLIDAFIQQYNLTAAGSSVESALSVTA